MAPTRTIGPENSKEKNIFAASLVLSKTHTFLVPIIIALCNIASTCGRKTKNQTITEDVRRVQSAFNRSAGIPMRKFHSVRTDMKKKLLDSLCLPMYGTNLWLSKKKSAGALKLQETFKKILRYRKYFSNHIVYAEFACLTIKHFMNYKFLKLHKNILNCRSTCLMDLNTCFNKFS